MKTITSDLFFWAIMLIVGANALINYIESLP